MRPLVLHDDVLVGHRWDIGAACDAYAVDGGDLGDTKGGHLGLRRVSKCRGAGRGAYHVVKDPPEVVLVGKDVSFAWCGRAAPPDSTRICWIDVEEKAKRRTDVNTG